MLRSGRAPPTKMACVYSVRLPQFIGIQIRRMILPLLFLSTKSTSADIRPVLNGTTTSRRIPLKFNIVESIYFNFAMCTLFSLRWVVDTCQLIEFNTTGCHCRCSMPGLYAAVADYTEGSHWQACPVSIPNLNLFGLTRRAVFLNVECIYEMHHCSCLMRFIIGEHRFG